MQGGERFNSINDYLKSVFDRKTVKLSIDAGFTCPNRDGSKGLGGCTFCSEGGSGELASHLAGFAVHNTSTEKNSRNPNNELISSMKSSITLQIDRLSTKWPDAEYIAYFQSFTGTYAPVSYLREIYYAALNDPRISGIAIATRPDCLPEDVLDLLDEINRDYFMWVELGLQSVHAVTQKSMNLCYTTADYDKSASALSNRGIRFVTHLILGLPGETEEMMLESLRYVCRTEINYTHYKQHIQYFSDSGFNASQTRVDYSSADSASDQSAVCASSYSKSEQNLAVPFGLKLHLMNTVKSSPLYKLMPDYVPFESMDEYVDLVVRCLEIIPPEITIHRLTADVPRRILISPEWSYRKRSILNAINRELMLRNTHQGAKVTS